MIPAILNLVLINILPFLVYVNIDIARLKNIERNREIIYFLLLIIPVFLLFYLVKIKLLILVTIFVTIAWIAVAEYYFVQIDKVTIAVSKSVNSLTEEVKILQQLHGEVSLQNNNVSTELIKYTNIFSLVQEINQNIGIHKIGYEFYIKVSSYFPDKIKYIGLLVVKKKDIVEVIPFSPTGIFDEAKIRSLWLSEKKNTEVTNKILEYKIYENQYQYILIIFHEFTREEISNFEFFVEETKIGFVRSILFKEVDELSRTDGLTGLYLRRYFLARLNEEIVRAVRYSQRFSLIMFDIDFFKKINDTYGHIVGDFVLKEVAGIIKTTVGDQGLCSRWGGEEFLVFVPYQSKEQVYTLAENIRKSIEQCEMNYEGHNIKITISGGISSYPDDAKEIEKLIELADQRLYKSKQAGRNLVTI